MPVVLVDDHPVVREGLAYLLAEQPDFDVVGQAEDPETALEVIERTGPRVIVLDLKLKGQDAIPLLVTLRERWPQLRILILSMHDEGLYAERMLALGAHGYVMKQDEPAEFLRALRRAAAGETRVSHNITERSMSRLRGRTPPVGSTGIVLTARERDA
jgi:DNA-binding NarL/FixJ family response regulator